MLRYQDTRLDARPGELRLLGSSGETLFALRGDAIELAVHSGFLDPEDWHYSLFTYARMRSELRGVRVVGPSAADRAESDERFLAGLDLRWD